MGEVYRAKDTKLGRDVALKILPASFTNDPERLARFRREAQVLASLNHPHIAQIYGLEEANGAQFLVLELVDGESLDKRIARGPIPVDEALGIAKQIAEALEAAHEKGIIHRDLKPANIALTKDGVVKVLDFGLAKAVETTSGPADTMNSPTITSPAMMTGVGVILGTAAYMSPEQAKGRPADKRSDIWAFGCVLYEMLAGRRAFDAEDVSETLASVLAREPNFDVVPLNVPPTIRTLIKRCLYKDRKQRISDVSTVLFVLNEPTSLSGADATATNAQAAPRSKFGLGRVVGLVAVGVASVGLVGGGLWVMIHPAASSVTRTMITPSGPAAMTVSGITRDVAITPDGSRVVYIGNNGTQLFVRALDTLEPSVIATSIQIRNPFVSPNGQWVGFNDSTLTLKKVSITGGPAIEVTHLDAPLRGATWATDDAMIFATDTGLQRVPAAGGTPVVLTKPDHARGEVRHLWPEVLPGGRAVLFTITAAGGPDAASIGLLDLQTGTTKIVLRGGSHAEYAASGHLVYGAAGALRAVPFDLTQRAVQGTAVSVVPRIVMSAFGAANFATANNGSLVYVDARGAGVGRTLVWVDRRGKEEGLGVPLRSYTFPSLSPDGTRLAVGSNDEEADIWTWDVRHGPPLTRLTTDPAVDIGPIWTSDGRRIIFASGRSGGVMNLWWQAADGSGTADRLTTSPDRQAASSVTPDGEVLFDDFAPNTGSDIMRLPLGGDRRPVVVLQTKANEYSAVVSRDGHWMAYESDTSGRAEIYVRPYPNVEAGPRQVSPAGGTRPLWARNGKELFYVAPGGALMHVPVDATAAVWNNGAPEKLFDMRETNIGALQRTYDVSPDGQRFLLNRPAATDPGTSPNMIVVQHFDEELKRLVPSK
jgi:serine/threonine-protein kinase